MDTTTVQRLRPSFVTTERIAFGDMEGDVAEPLHDRIAIHLSGTCRLERRGPGRTWRTYRPVRGDIAFAPAHSDSRFRNTGAVQVLKLSFSTALHGENGTPSAWNLSPATGVRDELLRALILGLDRLSGAGAEPNDPYRAALSEAVVQHLATHHMGARPPDVAALSRTQRERAVLYLQARVGGDFVLAGLARELGLSPSYASAQFKASFGRGPHAYFAALRMESARHLLLTTTKPACQIATEVGFSSPSYFGLAFRLSFGTTPTAFRKGADADQLK